MSSVKVDIHLEPAPDGRVYMKLTVLRRVSDTAVAHATAWSASTAIDLHLNGVMQRCAAEVIREMEQQLEDARAQFRAFGLIDAKPIECSESEKSLIDHGDFIGAIKEIRSRTGLYLKDAKAVADHYRKSAEHSARRLALEAKGSTSETQRETAVQGDLTDVEQRLVTEHKVIEAIRSVRARTGLGLKDAKDLVDRFRSGPPVTAPTVAPVIVATQPKAEKTTARSRSPRTTRK